MIKIKCVEMLGKELYIEPYDKSIWLYTGYNTKTNKYCNCVAIEKPDAKFDKILRDRIKFKLTPKED